MTSELFALEQRLWSAESRFDRALMAATFAPDCFEFGRSGRRFTREEMLFHDTDWQPIDATLHNLRVTHLATDIALVTYVSELRSAEGTEWGNRSSIWDRSSGRWQLRFHQGTKVPPEALP